MKRLLVPLAAAVAASGLATAAGAHGSHSTALTVTVKATEYKFALSRKSGHHGTVIFKVVNKGHIAHDFKIAGKKTAKLAPGKSATLKVTLRKGSYRYICTVAGHATLGMKGRFVAT
jgi:nitrite reductase (NO-forming)